MIETIKWTKEYRKEYSREYRQYPEHKMKIRESQQRFRDRPENKAKRKEYLQRPDVKVRIREYGKSPKVVAKREAKKRYYSEAEIQRIIDYEIYHLREKVIKIAEEDPALALRIKEQMLKEDGEVFTEFAIDGVIERTLEVIPHADEGNVIDSIRRIENQGRE